MLLLNPEEIIHFAKSGNEMVGIVTITNIVETPVTYKVSIFNSFCFAFHKLKNHLLQIKTTSPEKFRVRPSTGVLAPGTSSSINVVLVQGNNTLATLSKDKFLVMCMELGADSNTSTQDITELWKVRTATKILFFLRTLTINVIF